MLKFRIFNLDIQSSPPVASPTVPPKQKWMFRYKIA